MSTYPDSQTKRESYENIVFTGIAECCLFITYPCIRRNLTTTRTRENVLLRNNHKFGRLLIIHAVILYQQHTRTIRAVFMLLPLTMFVSTSFGVGLLVMNSYISSKVYAWSVVNSDCGGYHEI
jgi:hypothetical protein